MSDVFPRHLLLVSVDALRFDALGAETDARYLARVAPGLAARRRTPTLDALARGGTHFGCLITSAPYTTNAHASLFTGRWPWRHGARTLWSAPPAAADIRFLAQVLKDVGFSTMSASGMPHIFHADAPGFRRGVDDVLDVGTHLLGRNFPVLLDWMAAHRAGRFFAFHHPTGVHDYLTREARDRHAAAGVGAADVFYADLRRARGLPLNRRLEAYLDAVDFFDENELAPLVSFLRARGLFDETLIVLLGDHGEPHPHGLGEEEIRVPLVLAGAGAFPRGRKIDAPARMMDVLPTLLELLGIPGPAGVDGESLAPLWRGGGAPEREAYAEFFPVGDARPGNEPGGAPILLRGLRRDGRKVLRDYARDRWAAFDLAADWGEDHPLALSVLAGGEEMRARLEEIERLDPLAGAAAPSATAATPSADVLARLRQLGYLD